MFKISVVVNTLNRIKTLPKTLNSFQYLRYPYFEVIVVNGPSTDGTSEYLKTNWEGKVKLVDCPEANLSLSRNLGIEHSDGDIICFIDDDALPEPNWLDEIALSFKDPQVTAVGGFVRDNTGVSFQAKGIVSDRLGFSEVSLEDLSRLPKCVPGAQKIPGLMGVNSSFRADVLRELGGFDENYAYYLEETDVAFRLIDAGYKIVINPRAEVHHKFAPSNIRNEKILTSRYQICKSTAYFPLVNSRHPIPLDEIFNFLVKIKSNHLSDLQYLYNQKIIDCDSYNRQSAEVELGFSDGIKTMFGSCRRKLGHFSSVPSLNFKKFPILLNAGERLSFVLLPDLYPPQKIAGIGVFMHKLAVALASEGHDVTVIVQTSDEFNTVNFEEGVWVHRIRSEDFKPYFQSNAPALPSGQANYANSVYLEVQRICKTRKPDLILGTIWDLNLLALIDSKEFPVAMYLVTSYKLMKDCHPEWEGSEMYQKMIEAEKWALENVDVILASTNSIKKDIFEAYELEPNLERKVRLIPFGIEEVPVQVSKTEKEETESNEVNILFVGRLEKRKGIDVLLQVIPDLLAKYPNISFHIVGRDDIPSQDTGMTYKDEFVSKNFGNLDMSRVIFHGEVSDEELQFQYRNCDVFVAPSRYESFGLIFIEAMRYGKPCIGVKIGGMQEVVRDKVTGTLVEELDKPNLKKALEDLIVSKDKRKQFGEAGKRLFEKDYSLSNFSKNIIELAQKMRRDK